MQTPLQECVNYSGFAAAQEGVGRLFQRDSGGDAGQVGCPQLFGGGDTLLHGGVVGFAGYGKAQIGCGVFVGAVHLRSVGQAGKALQRMVQLGQRTFKISAATRAKQHIAAEQNFRYGVGCKVGDVVVEVSGNGNDVKRQSERVQVYSFTVTQIMADVRIVFMPSSIHRRVVYCAQLGDAADMVVVTMGAENGGQSQFPFSQEFQYGHRCTGIHHNGLAVVVYGPDVVVLQGGDSGNFEHKS